MLNSYRFFSIRTSKTSLQTDALKSRKLNDDGYSCSRIACTLTFVLLCTYPGSSHQPFLQEKRSHLFNELRMNALACLLLEEGNTNTIKKECRHQNHQPFCFQQVLLWVEAIFFVALLPLLVKSRSSLNFDPNCQVLCQAFVIHYK